MEKIRYAVILAAGLGSRLKPLTDEEPKCLTEVGGKSILQQSLESLEKNGIEEAVIVVGYLGNIIEKKVGKVYRNMKISYIYNEIYQDTNSMYSAWLAREYIEKGCLLLEGDTVFDNELIEKAVNTDEKSYWVLDRFRPEYDGSMSKVADDGRIKEVSIVRGKLSEYKKNYYKSTGILKITKEYGVLLSKWLQEDVDRNEVKIYYDIVIANHIADAPLYCLDITGAKWFEIDSLQDLQRAETIFSQKKFVVVVLDGVTDEPHPALEGKTPLEMAQVPTLSSLAKKGKFGKLKTIYSGLPVDSIVANMGILGYNPWRYYPNGRSSFEALAHDIYLNPGDLAFRCNLVSVDEGVLTDFTADNIAFDVAQKLVSKVGDLPEGVELYAGQSYRNILVIRNAFIDPSKLVLHEPHENCQKRIEDILPSGTDDKSKRIADILRTVMSLSGKRFEELNRGYESKANMLYPWSVSTEPKLPSFHRKFGMDGAIISGLDFMRGFGIASRMESKKISNATGYSDTDLIGKTQVLKNSLRFNDFAFLHINATDEEAHRKNPKGKIAILERIDKEVLAPLYQHLEEKYGDNFRLAIMTDHYTSSVDGKHRDYDVPYFIVGAGIEADTIETYDENSTKSLKTLLKSYEFIEFFLNV